jgi:hypothetical protein
MFNLFLDNIILLWGLFAFIFGLYKVIKNHGGLSHILWLIGGIITVAVIILDHTMLIDLTLSGQEQVARNIKNLTDVILVAFWLYIAYKERYLNK